MDYGKATNMAAIATDFDTTAARPARRRSRKVFAIYCRISNDAQGRAEGVEAQEAWGRAYAAAHFQGMPVEVFVDNDITAADENVRRPEFERLGEWVRDGRIAEVWAVEQQRLDRTWRWFGFAAALERAGIQRLHTNNRGVTPLDDIGTDVMAVVGVHEVRGLKRRIQAKKDVLASQGRPAGGLVYGYKPGVDGEGRKTLTVVRAQAVIVQEVYRRYLDGDSMTSIARDMEARGVKGARGSDRLGQATIRSWLRSAAVAGLRRHKGEILRDAAGEPVRGTWAPIVDLETWQRVQVKMDGRAQTHRGSGPGNRRYMLSGRGSGCVMRCECGGAMYGRRKVSGKGRPKQLVYSCYDCGSSMDMATVDDLVSGRLLERLDRLAAALGEDEAAEQRDEIAAELEAVDGRRKMLARRLGAGKMTEDDYDEALEEVNADRDRLTALLAELPDQPPDTVDVNTVRASWDRLTDRERRMIIDRFVKVITVAKLKPGQARRKNTDRIRITGPGW